MKIFLLIMCILLFTFMLGCSNNPPSPTPSEAYHAGYEAGYEMGYEIGYYDGFYEGAQAGYGEGRLAEQCGDISNFADWFYSRYPQYR